MNEERRNSREPYDATKVKWKAKPKYTKGGREIGKRKNLEGWSPAGHRRFAALQKLVAENRRWTGSKEVEKEAMKVWNERHKLNENRDKDSVDESNEDEDSLDFEEVHYDNDGNVLTEWMVPV